MQGVCNGQVSVRSFVYLSLRLTSACRCPRPRSAADAGSVMSRAEGRGSTQTCLSGEAKNAVCSASLIARRTLNNQLRSSPVIYIHLYSPYSAECNTTKLTKYTKSKKEGIVQQAHIHINLELSPSISPYLYQSWYLSSSPQDPPLPAGLPIHLTPLLLRLRFGFWWPLCAFINFTYLITYLLTYVTYST